MNKYYYDSEGGFYPDRITGMSSKKPLKYFWHDTTMDAVDWKTEPSTDLLSLYKERAEQIRDEYEYVIVAYSGGIDSTNVLETFYYNNIHVDEIITVGALSKDSVQGSDENHNGDLYHNVFPTLNDLDLPNTKISVMDYSLFFDDPSNFTLATDHGEEWYRYIGTFQGYHHFFWHDLRKFISKNDSRKTAVVFGTDKPNLIVRPAEWRFSTRFIDLPLNGYGGWSQNGNFSRVNFYTDPASIDIMRKQLHMAARFYISNVMVHKKLTHEQFYRGYETIVPSIVYPSVKHPLAHRSQKTKANISSPRDNFMIHQTDSKMHQIYAAGIDRMKEVVDISKKIPIFTKEYLLF